MRAVHKRRQPEMAVSTAGGEVVVSEKLATFRRVYRWLNLTLVQQATWPLLLLLTSAPGGTPEEIPMPWYLARLGAPAAAALLALFYLKERPIGRSASAVTDLELDRPVRSPFAKQARFLLLGLPAMVLAARLVAGPVGPVTKLAFFGLADVAAFHLINFGVLARSFPQRERGLAAAVLFMGLSWGLQSALLVAFGPETASPILAFFAGGVAGIAVALCCRGIWRWPGGLFTAPAAQWLVIYLIFGFVN
jgi:hypothetical protein